MLNAEKYKDDILAMMSDTAVADDTLLSMLISDSNIKVDLQLWYTSQDYRYQILLEWLLKESKEVQNDLLTDEERMYLKQVLEPYTVNYLQKLCLFKAGREIEYLRIVIGDGFTNSAFGLKEAPKGTTFKGLQFERKYYLKELGI